MKKSSGQGEIFAFFALLRKIGHWKIKKKWKKVHSIDIFVDDRIREIVHCIAVHCIESLLYSSLKIFK